jgi:hypothetical protein
MTNKEARFLPDYLKKGFDSAQVNNDPLVDQSVTILSWQAADKGFNAWFTPFLTFTVLLIIVAGLTLSKTSRSLKALRVFDRIFFFIIGLLGLLMWTLWIIRIDTVCRNNFNVLWALPTHMVAAFFIGNAKKWLVKYFEVVFWLGIVLAFTWFFIPQQINNAVGPLILLIIIRSYQYTKKSK